MLDGRSYIAGAATGYGSIGNEDIGSYDSGAPASGGSSSSQGQPSPSRDLDDEIPF